MSLSSALYDEDSVWSHLSSLTALGSPFSKPSSSSDVLFTASPGASASSAFSASKVSGGESTLLELSGVIILSPLSLYLALVLPLTAVFYSCLTSKHPLLTSARARMLVVVIAVYDTSAHVIRPLLAVLSPYQWLFFSVSRGAHPVYLIDYALFSAPASWRVPTDRFLRIALHGFKLRPDSVQFTNKVLASSGLGENTSFPPGICDDPPHIAMRDARMEAEQVMFSCIDQLFSSSSSSSSGGGMAITAASVDILIVNCSLFVPTPSLSAMIINHYKMRSTVQSYNLGGMGCSAGLIAVHLARDLLQVHRNSVCLVVSTELITQSIYLGDDRAMLLSNALFRCGGAAVLMSNRASHSTIARFQLHWTHRSTFAADDQAYRTVFQDECDAGKKGVRLDKNLIRTAERVLTKHIASIAPLLLTKTEIMRFVMHKLAETVMRCVRHILAGKSSKRTSSSGGCSDEANKQSGLGSDGGTGSASAEKDETHSSSSRGGGGGAGGGGSGYRASFSGVCGVCIHSGGRAVLDGLQRALRLDERDMAASRHVLREYGNVSSASVWYEMHYIEQCNRHYEQHQQQQLHLTMQHNKHDKSGGSCASRELQCTRVAVGDFVWQLGFGSGFKVNSALWKRLR